MRSYVQQQVETRQAELANLDRQAAEIERRRLVIAAEISAYQDVLKRMGADTPSAPTAPSQDAISGREQRGSQTLRLEPAAEGGRFSAQWGGLLGFLCDRYPAITTNDDMMAWGKSHGHAFTRHSMRAQLWGWSNRGYVERIVDGQYRITAKGAAAIGRHLDHKTREGPALSVEPSLEFGGG